jgi:hypothetical protein
VMEEPHAVRWARRKVRGEYEWTRWHYTVDSSMTVCGLPIRLGNEQGTFLPETDDAERTDCCRCKTIYCRVVGDSPHGS